MLQNCTLQLLQLFYIVFCHFLKFFTILTHQEENAMANIWSFFLEKKKDRWFIIITIVTVNVVDSFEKAYINSIFSILGKLQVTTK